MEGTQSRLNFLPEKHTDFIFTTLAEEFGFIGSIVLLVLYALIIIFCMTSMLGNRNRFGALLTGPLVSYGGSAMLVLMGAFGLVQSAHVHRPRIS